MPEPQTWAWRPGCDALLAWQDWARDASAWLQREGVEPRSALVTLPVGAVLAPARAAWAQAVGGWMPRIETIASLAEANSWARTTPAWDETTQETFGAALSLDAIEDRLQAARSLGRQDWARQWARRDRRGHEFAVSQVVDAAHVWLRSLQAIAPSERTQQLALWRVTLGDHMGTDGPGGRERLLLAWALEWVAVSAEESLPMDAVFAQRPSAWLAVTAGPTVLPGSEGALMLGALRSVAALGVPVRWWAAEVQPACEGGEPSHMSVSACGDLLDEARQAAAQVLRCAADRAEGDAPVGVLALDRSVVRHVRALLEGGGLVVADETGWLLSTTRAAAACTRMLAASNPRASTDELLDWLRSGWVSMADSTQTRAATGLLERWCRRQGLISAWSGQEDEGALARQRMPDEAKALWAWSQQALQPLQDLWRVSRPSLQQWLQALQQALAQSGVQGALQADAAGSLLWESLRMDALVEGAQSLPESHRVTRMDGASFQRWLSDMLEAVTFRPQAESAQPDVLITTLARAALRPFHAVVMPGCDEKQLGSLGAPSGWLGVRLREAMGLVTPALARQAQWEAFRLVATRPRLHALHRRAEGSEPLEASAWLARWSAIDAGVRTPGQDPRLTQTLPACPVAPPMPVLGAHGVGLPERLSATHYEVLRQCPYRFFAQVVLRLQTQDELQEGLDRSDQGSWLHEVLRRFHEVREQRLAQPTEQSDMALWLEQAEAAAREMGLLSEAMRAHYRPHELALPDLAKAYVGWLHRHEQGGWRVRACEVEREQLIDLSEAGSDLRLRLVGQLDRIDVRHGGADEGGVTHAMVIDYKTGNADVLKKKVKSGTEDTQLAFYAALSEGDVSGDLQAAYVHIDARKVEAMTHADIQASAELLLAQLRRDWLGMHQGAALQALGEGAACEHCAMRGLCRRDHWQLATQSASSPVQEQA